MAALLVLAGCGGGGGGGGGGGAGEGFSTITNEVVLEAEDENCPTGGSAFDVGIDANGNGVLDEDEVTETVYVCNGEDGQVSLIFISGEPAGDNCAYGGERVDAGLDDNGDGVLDADEIDTTTYVCDGDPGTDGAPGNAAPVADAGIDQQIITGQAVTLNGSASTDADGDALTYAWSFLSSPGPSPSLSGADTAAAGFTPAVDGEYVLQLIVDDGTAGSPGDTVTITANSIPVAHAGPDQNVASSATVTLDGSASTDPDPSGGLSYTWTQTAGNPVTLSDAGAVMPTFVAGDRAQPYTFNLVVSDGDANSSTDGVDITVVNAPPAISGTPTGTSQGKTYSYTFTSGDADAGDTLFFSDTGVTPLPAWVALNAATGELTGFPQAADILVTVNHQVTVTDGAASDTVEFSLTVSDDLIAPTLDVDWAVSDATAPSETTWTGQASLDESGNGYCMAVDPGTTAPSVVQMIADTDPGSRAGISGTVVMGDPAVTYDCQVTDLEESVAYDFYFAAQDDAGNSVASVVAVTAATTVSLAPVTDVAWSFFSRDSVSITGEASLHEAGTGYCVAVTNDAVLPISTAVRDGSDVNNQGTPGTVTMSNPALNYDCTVTGLAPATGYDVYFVAEDSLGNLQASVAKLDILTKALAGIVLVQSGGSTNVTEMGATDSFTLELTSQPEGDVTIAVTSSDAAAGVVLTDADQTGQAVIDLTFNSGDWNAPRTVTVTAADDPAFEGDHDASLTFSVALSGDAEYTALNLSAISLIVNIIDDDTYPDVTAAAAAPGDGEVVLDWADSTGAVTSMTGVRVLRRTDGVYPTGPLDGDAVEVDNVLPGVETRTDGSLANGVLHTYLLFAHDDAIHARGIAIESTPLSAAPAETQKVGASDAQASDRFGWSVAVSGHYAIVGANLEDTGGTNSGAAYVFERDGNGDWIEVDILKASDAQASDNFGRSVSLSGDTAIVGAYLEDTTATDAGAAYIFERDVNGNWIEVAILHASDATTFDYFGWSVALSGDYAIVGAYLEDRGSVTPISNAGAVYVFERDPTTGWAEVAILYASDAQTSDQF
ncbi:MAG: hypothetical protein IID61_18260, partial [SAR324 cluster bacterium]|nr:hypothetical protein [SAR324 cluster bacterium]